MQRLVALVFLFAPQETIIRVVLTSECLPYYSHHNGSYDLNTPHVAHQTNQVSDSYFLGGHGRFPRLTAFHKTKFAIVVSVIWNSSKIFGSSKYTNWTRTWSQTSKTLVWSLLFSSCFFFNYKDWTFAVHRNSWGSCNFLSIPIGSLSWNSWNVQYPTFFQRIVFPRRRLFFLFRTKLADAPQAEGELSENQAW